MGLNRTLRAAKLGTIVRLPDGRVGTTVLNSLSGVGIKWGRHDPDPAVFEGTHGGTLSGERDVPAEWHPDAMLRDPYPSAVLPCVGEVFVVERFGLDGEGEDEAAALTAARRAVGRG